MEGVSQDAQPVIERPVEDVSQCSPKPPTSRITTCAPEGLERSCRSDRRSALDRLLIDGL
jgi:hypothetical protein